MQKAIHGGDIYRNNVKFDFSANINPLGTPESVMTAMVDSLKNCANYPDVNCTQLVKALSKHENVPEDTILCGNGAADVIFSLVYAVKPQKALIQAPTFAEYEQALKSVDCGIEYFYTKKEQNFEITSEILSYISNDLDIMFLCNPNNPTGVLIDAKLLQEIADKCQKCNVIFVIDECFQEFIDEKQSAKSHFKQNTQIVILKAFTKIYALAGIRLGYCMSHNKKLLAKMKSCTQPWNVSVVAQAAGVSALLETKFVEKTLDFIKTERQFLISNLKKLNFYVYNSKANYIFFEADEDLFDKCLEKGILIRDCSNYVGLKKGFYRIAVRTRTENESLINTLTDIQGD